MHLLFLKNHFFYIICYAIDFIFLFYCRVATLFRYNFHDPTPDSVTLLLQNLARPRSEKGLEDSGGTERTPRAGYCDTLYCHIRKRH